MDTTNSRRLRTRLDALAIEFGLSKLPRIPRPVMADRGLYPLVGYLSMSSDRRYLGFGATIEERLSNIQQFLGSEAYYSLSSSMQGSVVEVANLRNAIAQITDEKLRRNLSSMLGRCDSLGGRTIILPRSLEGQDDDMEGSMLYHELVHMLLIHNSVCQPISSQPANRVRKFCEGLTIFMQHYFEEYGTRSLAFLKAYAEGKDEGSQFYEYSMYASRIGRVFDRARTPAARREAISRLLPSKSRQNKPNLQQNFGDNRKN